MRTPVGRIRNVMYLLFALLIATALAACGGSGGGSTSSTSPGVSGPASVRVSIASAPSYPAGTTFASSTLSPATAAPPANSPTFDNVLVTVTKISLIPSTGHEFPDPNGELENSSADEGNGIVTDTFDPVVINLRDLTPDNAALLLNQFIGVPAGEYSKIRVYYSSVVGQKEGEVDQEFHPTAHYHFDVHFVGGNLVIPFTSDSQGGIRFYSVQINVVGLKYHEAGQSGNILLRPQVFATADNSSLKYLVSGTAQNVNPAENTFDIDTPGGMIVSARYDGATGWIYIDNTITPVNRSSDVGEFLGSSGLDNSAHVDVMGTFSSDNVLLATDVDITFPEARIQQKVFLGWNLDNTITLRFIGDNTVFLPNAMQDAAYYDNAASPYNVMYSDAIVDNVVITARGYKKDPGNNIKAYWISIWPLTSP